MKKRINNRNSLNNPNKSQLNSPLYNNPNVTPNSLLHPFTFPSRQNHLNSSANTPNGAAKNSLISLNSPIPLQQPNNANNPENLGHMGSNSPFSGPALTSPSRFGRTGMCYICIYIYVYVYVSLA